MRCCATRARFMSVMAVVVLVSFSPNGEYLAYSSPDGVLKLWETTTGKLAQEYTPSSHLSATCSCLQWGPNRRPRSTPKKKKKRKSISVNEALENLELIALGTTSGTLLLYNVIKGGLHTQLEEGHTDTVRDICWSPDEDTIYSAGDDHTVFEWSLSRSTVKRKWTADKQHGISAVCLCQGGEYLLTASRKITLWDLKNLKPLKTFAGHATSVFRLLSVVHTHQNDEVTGTTANGNFESTYFFSAAHNDRLINVWNIRGKNRTAVASFSIPDEPIYAQLRPPRQDGEAFILLVVTKEGQLHIFEQSLNGNRGARYEPLQPKVNLQIVQDESRKGETPRPLQLLGACTCNKNVSQVMVAYGNFLKPVFEKLLYSTMNKNEILIRRDPCRTFVQKEESISKVKSPGVSEHVTHLGPSHMTPAAPFREDGTTGKKKRRKSTEMTMEDRLNAISIDKPGERRSTSSLPKADTLATLLTQGLKTKDQKALNKVLQHHDETIIRNTVRQLPLPVIVPFVQQLTKRLQGHSQSGQLAVRWIQAVLTQHMSYLMTIPELMGLLGSLYQMMESRVSTFSRLSKLHGKLELVLSQISAKDNSEEKEEEETAVQPMLLFQDESSEEEVEDLIPGDSESDYISETSDMEVNREEKQRLNSHEEESMSEEDG